MNLSEAIWTVARQHFFLYSGFILFTAAIALGQALRGRGEAKWMALMTGVWVVINSCIAVWLFRHIHVPATELLPLVFSHITRYMRLNVIADAVYALVGFFLLSRKGLHRPLLRGFGKAVVLQGVGLILLDAVFLCRVIALHQQYLAR
jgi:hypothetical protein